MDDQPVLYGEIVTPLEEEMERLGHAMENALIDLQERIVQAMFTGGRLQEGQEAMDRLAQFRGDPSTNSGHR